MNQLIIVEEVDNEQENIDMEANLGMAIDGQEESIQSRKQKWNEWVEQQE